MLPQSFDRLDLLKLARWRGILSARNGGQEKRDGETSCAKSERREQFEFH
jgi:hypothetical protein